MFAFRYFTQVRRVAVVCFGFTMAVTMSAAAQRAVVERCPAGSARVGTLGYAELACSKCTLYQPEDDPRGQRWEFSSEPTIGGIKPDGPAAGKLREGDVIAAIDGHLITTSEGGRRFGQLEAGTPVTLRVRRGGREIDVSVTPAAVCKPVREVARAPRAVPRPVREPRPPTAPAAPRPARTIAVPAPPALPGPKARLGFSLQCSNCSINQHGDTVAWSFRAAPVVQRVERVGPARAAGIQAGDILTHIGGTALTSDEGGRLFGAIEPGDTVRFRLLRDGKEREVKLVPGLLARRLTGPTVAPAVPSAPAPAPAAAPVAAPTPLADVPEQRFSGTLGDALVQVTGGPITVTRTENEIVIRSQDITVRISRSGAQ